MNEIALFALQYLSVGAFLGVCCGLVGRYAFNDPDAEFTATLIAVFWPVALPLAILAGVIKLVFRWLP